MSVVFDPMDYLPFIMILTALGFEHFKTPRSLWIKIALVVLSVAIGFWGRYWGTRLGVSYSRFDYALGKDFASLMASGEGEDAISV
jgi:hypothetical protein